MKRKSFAAVSQAKKAAAFVLLALTLSSPGKADAEFNGLPSVKEIIAASRENALAVPPVTAPEQSARQTEKEWTIMIFMNGKNDLTDYIIKDINEMEEFGSPDNVNVVMQAGRMNYNSYRAGKAAQDPSVKWFGVRRYLLKKDGDNRSLSSELLQDLGKPDMGDWRQLAEFGKWARQNYPARRYMLVVWNHGSGWMIENNGGSDAKAISYDTETGHAINPADLAGALREMGGVDIYASDACLMQMAEVVYELRDVADIVVGSEETEPGDGWGYQHFLSRVHANKNALTPETMAAAVVQGYKATYAKTKEHTTMSALRTAGAYGFRRLVDEWADLLMQEDRNLLNDSVPDTTGFEGADSMDLIGLMDAVHTRSKSEAVTSKTKEALSYFYANMFIDNAATGENFTDVRGLAVYVPSFEVDPSYKRLAWAADGNWDELMQWRLEGNNRR